MMGIIRIKLMSDLCAGNGESVGYGVDTDICTDNYGFPYIPGKRILGCLRDSAIQLGELGLQEANKQAIDTIFGNENGAEGQLSIGNAIIPGIDSLHSYIRSLEHQKERDYLIRQCTEEKIIRLFSSVRGQTQIGEDGKAKGGSLRFIRVLNHYDPFTENEMEFVCEVDTTRLDEKQVELVEKACKTLRHIGLNRTRGLGNVLVIPELNASAVEKCTEEILDHSSEDSEQVRIEYQVEFDSPITVQEYLESTGQINARMLIGVFSSIYLRQHEKPDDTFENLFLNGNVKWSALTPVINGARSNPVPAMIMKLKNDNGKFENTFATKDEKWKKKKPKSLDGYFASLCVHEGKKEVFISRPEVEISYHNRINETDNKDRTRKGLYMQDALQQGMVYGGYVILPKDQLVDVKTLFNVRKIRLGRSKKTQYGTATIKNIVVENFWPKKISVEDRDPVVAILRSDLAIQDNAVYRTDSAYIREIIARETGLSNIIPDQIYDICRYHILSGYHSKWHMQKPKIPVVMGGSVYCFAGKKGTYPSYITIGEYQQEGMGHIELLPMSSLKEMVNISDGRISTIETIMQEEKISDFEQRILFEAVQTEIKEYAFKFKKADDEQDYRYRILKDIPTGRLRQMLMEANNITDLWTMVESMKTSDVSSESDGKRTASIRLIKKLYGEDKNSIDFEAMIKDKALWKEVQNSTNVLERLQRNWKEPMSTLLHMTHYQKGRR